jgi:hypothetical protein
MTGTNTYMPDSIEAPNPNPSFYLWGSRHGGIPFSLGSFLYPVSLLLSFTPLEAQASQTPLTLIGCNTSPSPKPAPFPTNTFLYKCHHHALRPRIRMAPFLHIRLPCHISHRV